MLLHIITFLYNYIVIYRIYCPSFPGATPIFRVIQWTPSSKLWYTTSMKPILLDCDPGHDDMAAILLAAGSEEIDLLGITTVAGNQTADKTFLNARKTLALLGREDIPVYAGAERPLVRDLVTAPGIHGKSGLDGAELPPPREKPTTEHAVDFLERTLLAGDGGMTLVATGPLTNVALLLLKAPRVQEKIEGLVIMGGGSAASNVTPAAEFNIYVDPEAARTVFSSGLPITLVTVDITNTALFTDSDIRSLEESPGRVSPKVGGLLRFFYTMNNSRFGLEGAPLHDPLTVAHVIRPEVIVTRPVFVDVETQGELTRGRTVIDFFGVTGKPANARVSTGLDLDLYKHLLFEAIRRFD
jgi:inosine-uridine nucleoside N-ribohydrolase